MVCAGHVKRKVVDRLVLSIAVQDVPFDGLGCCPIFRQPAKKRIGSEMNVPVGQQYHQQSSENAALAEVDDANFAAQNLTYRCIGKNDHSVVPVDDAAVKVDDVQG
jgi:hypothetical protein